jgi:glutamine amidotransferase
MSARFPTTLRLSFQELAQHGGGTGPHRDGWGIGFYQEGDALLIREPDAASRSGWVDCVQDRQPRGSIAVAHVRKATQGARLLRNTQPFARELGGRMHLFAHNGMLPQIEADPRFAIRRFRRVGETDSEHAFCALLERLASRWRRGMPELDHRLQVVRAFAADLRTLGPANFLYSDGDALFAHGHRRRREDGAIEPPGLHVLCRSCSAARDALPSTDARPGTAERQMVALVASVPLTSESWRPLAEGEIVVLRDGQLMRGAPLPCSAAPASPRDGRSSDRAMQ